MNDQSGTARRLGGQTSLLFAGYLFTLLVGLPLQMYVARVLGATQLGVFSLLESGVGILVGLAGLGIAPVLVRFIPQHLQHREYSSIRRLLSRGVLLLLTTGLLCYLLTSLTLPFLQRLWPQLALESATATALVMGALIPLSLLAFFLQQGLRGLQEVRNIVLGSSIFQLLCKVLLTVVFFQAGYQLLGYAWAVVGSTFFSCLWLAAVLWKRVAAMPADTGDGKADNMLQWRSYATLMYGNSLLSVSSQYVDRFLLSYFVGVGPVGVLVVLTQLTQIPTVALGVLISAVAPMLAAASARGDTTERLHLYHLTTDWAVRLALPLLVFLFVFTDPILRLYGDEFSQQGLWPFRIFLLGVALNLGTGPIGNVLNMSGMEGPLFSLNIQQTVTLLAGYCLLVPPLGITGAAISIVINNIYGFWRAFILARRLGIRWWNRRYQLWVWPGISVMLLALVLRWQLLNMGAAALVIVVAILYGVFAAVSLWQGLGDDDRALIAHLRAKAGFVTRH